MFVSDCYKFQKLCDKVVDNNDHALFVPEYCNTQEMCEKAVMLVPLYFILSLTGIKPKKCLIKLFPKILLC